MRQKQVVHCVASSTIPYSGYPKTTLNFDILVVLLASLIPCEENKVGMSLLEGQSDFLSMT